MILYKAITRIDFQDIDGNGDITLVKTHSVLKASIKLSRKLQIKQGCIESSS